MAWFEKQRYTNCLKAMNCKKSKVQVMAMMLMWYTIHERAMNFVKYTNFVTAMRCAVSTDFDSSHLTEEKLDVLEKVDKLNSVQNH